ncbi:hypothetical protein CE91St38_22770 [Desulfovibrionaceae bacterium]|nr:hypothetical protein CE91St38_22770 [Desulfovibrionaceae bacterium]GKI12819.1 hypothetical protein CE91St39_22730 [Desulfovibrionaceae bacterium]
MQFPAQAGQGIRGGSLVVAEAFQFRHFFPDAAAQLTDTGAGVIYNSSGFVLLIRGKLFQPIIYILDIASVAPHSVFALPVVRAGAAMPRNHGLREAERRQKAKRKTNS